MRVKITTTLYIAALTLYTCHSGNIDIVYHNSCFNALWSWTFPITDSEQERLITSSKHSNITLIFLNFYSPIPNSEGYYVPEFSQIENLDLKAQNNNIYIFPAYGSPEWIHQPCDSSIVPLLQGIIAYLGDKQQSALKGIALDIEPSEPIPQYSFIALLEFLKCTTDFLHSHNLISVIAYRFFWTDSVYFNGTLKPVHQHIIDIADISVVMAYRDFAGTSCPDNGIICLTEPSVAYTSSIGKPLLIGIETMNCVPDCGPEYVTFYEEGQHVMNIELKKVLKHFSDASIGFSIHAYQQEFLKGTQQWQVTNPDLPCPTPP